MKRNLSLLVLVVMLLYLALAACAGGGAPRGDWEVRISGAVSNPMTLTYNDLAKREMVTLENVLMRRSQGEDRTNTWEGPALAAILEEAGMSANATGLVCSAADGYAMEMTMDDLKGGIIALKVDGEWLATEDPSDPLRIVLPDKPANFWVRQLIEINVVE
jgi:DMSO/TMAO reductase YedYZ molybdopterin-dependent catalytic subunit